MLSGTTPYATEAIMSVFPWSGVLAAGVALLLAPALGCVPASPAVTVHSAVRPLSGPCPLDASGGAEFTAEAESLRLTIAADDIRSSVTAEGPVGALTVEEVPAGTGRVVGLFGLVGGQRVWRGVTRNVVVEEDKESSVNVFMARVADLSCGRGPDTAARAFHSATALPDGTILVVGGAAQSEAVTAPPCGAGCRRLTASAAVSIYDPTVGKFTSVGTLASPRMFHTAALLDDGRVVIAGGTAEALVHGAEDAGFPFPIHPTQPVAEVEVFDPATRRITSAGADPEGPRVFASAATLRGEALITGGIPAVATPNNLGNALSSTTICGGAPLRCRPGPSMASRRAGHVAFRVGDDRVYVWGGSVDTDSINGVDRFQVELIRDAGSGFALLEVAGMYSNRNLFFPATAQYVRERILAAGGLLRTGTGNFQLSTIRSPQGDDVAAVYVYDLTAGEAGGIADGTGRTDGAEKMHLRTPRFFGSAAPLPGGDRVIIAGGYADLAFAPSSDVDLYDQRSLTVSTLSVGGTARTLREARGGLVAATNGDGAVVFLGGEAPQAGGRGPLSTAEIFADPITPPGVAE